MLIYKATSKHTRQIMNLH